MTSWGEYAKLNEAQTPQEILNSPIWYNEAIGKETIYVPNWYYKGIRTIGDMIKADGTIMSVQEVVQTYATAQINFLEYHRIKVLVQKYISKLKPNTNIQLANEKPNIPFQYTILFKIKSGAKDIYRILRNKDSLNYSNKKWEDNLQIQISTQDWKDIFKICYYTLKDNYLIWMQYKIINRILGNRYYLHKLKILNSPNCIYCKLHQETLLHLLYECEEVRSLWVWLSKWINEKLKIAITFNVKMIILGYMERDTNYIPLNSIILIAKSYIFWSSRNKLPLDINQLQKRIKSVYSEQLFIYTKRGNEDKFLSSWNYWSCLM